MELSGIQNETVQAMEELVQAASLAPGQLVVIGCSTSEIQGKKIGSLGSPEVARGVLAALLAVTGTRQLFLAIQCCEHLNRALVVERQAMERFGLEQVSVIPVPKAGGSLAAQAMNTLADPVVVETVQAHAGMDIGHTLIGMHLRRVAVPVRLTVTHIGQAGVTAARTRPKLIGGERAVYQ